MCEHFHVELVLWEIVTRVKSGWAWLRIIQWWALLLVVLHCWLVWLWGQSPL
jgi:hypothetical protein